MLNNKSNKTVNLSGKTLSIGSVASCTIFDVAIAAYRHYAKFNVEQPMSVWYGDCH